MDDVTIIVLAGIGALSLIALAIIYPQLKVKFKRGKWDLSIDGSKPQELPTNAASPLLPSTETKKIVAGNRNDARQLTNLNQISEPTADFVGREKEIEELLAAFDGASQGAVISGVHGMGGVGKTELAKVFANRIKARYPDAQIYFNLRGATEDTSTKPATPEEALSHVIRSFHPEAKLPEDTESLKAQYNSVLDKKQVLLLMDNAHDAAQLAPLTPPPQGCALMVNSRQHFTLPGMKAIDLDTMPPPDAQKLLLEICPRIQDEAESLAKLCGHLPLALRLAASALKARPTLKVASYIEDLSKERGRLGTLGKYKNETGEKLSVEASLAISYNLLDEDLKKFWRALGVFPGDFDSLAAGAVGPLPDGKDAETALGDLHAASMTQWDKATGRFRLHDLAREFAHGQLSDEERVATEQRYAEHYLMILGAADELYEKGGTSVLEGLAIFDREWGNIAAGQAWASSRREIDKVAAKLCSDYPHKGTYCLALRIHSRQLIVWLDAAIGAAKILADRRAEGHHLGNLGTAYAVLGETNKAIDIYEQRIIIARELRDRQGEEKALGNLGIAYKNLGKIRKAIEYHELALTISRELKDRRAEGNILGNLGVAYKNLGETQKAIEYHENALVISRKLEDRHSEGIDLLGLGIAYAALGQMHKAIDFYEQALVMSRELEDRRSEGGILGNLATAYVHIGDTQKGIEFYEQRLDIARDIEDRSGEGVAIGNLGAAYWKLGETRKAVDFYEQRLDIARDIGDLRGEGVTSFNLAAALPEIGRLDEAIGHAEKAVEIYEEIESPNLAKARAQLERLRKRPEE